MKMLVDKQYIKVVQKHTVLSFSQLRLVDKYTSVDNREIDINELEFIDAVIYNKRLKDYDRRRNKVDDTHKNTSINSYNKQKNIVVYTTYSH